MKFSRFLVSALCAMLVVSTATDAFAFVAGVMRKRRQQQQIQQQQPQRQQAPRRRVIQRVPQRSGQAIQARSGKPRETLQQHLAKVRQGTTAGAAATGAPSAGRHKAPAPAEPIYQSRVLKSQDSSNSSVLVR